MGSASEELHVLAVEMSAIATSGDAHLTHVYLSEAVVKLRLAPGELNSASEIVGRADGAHENAETYGKAAAAAGALAVKASQDAEAHEQAAKAADDKAKVEAKAALDERVKAADYVARAAIATMPPPNPAAVTANTAKAAVHKAAAATHETAKDQLESESSQEQKAAAKDRREERDQTKVAASNKQQQKEEEAVERRYRTDAAGAIEASRETIREAASSLAAAHSSAKDASGQIARGLGGEHGTTLPEGVAAVQLSGSLPEEIEAVKNKVSGFLDNLPHQNSEHQDFHQTTQDLDAAIAKIEELRVRAETVIDHLEDTARILDAESDNLR